MKEEKMPLIMKHIVWLDLAWQWRYLTDKTGFLFIGMHCIWGCSKKVFWANISNLIQKVVNHQNCCHFEEWPIILCFKNVSHYIAMLGATNFWVTTSHRISCADKRTHDSQILLSLKWIQWNLVITRSLGSWKLPCYIRFLIIRVK